LYLAVTILAFYPLKTYIHAIIKFIFMKKVFLFLLIAASLYSCDKTTVEPDLDPNANVKNHSIMVQNQLNTNAKLMIDLFGGVAYTSAEAKSKQKDIDFVYWQYTGTAINHDTYLKSPSQIDNDASGAGISFSQSVGIDTWTTLNDPIASATDVTEGAFDSLKTNSQLISLHDKNTHTMVNYTTVTDVLGDLQGKVFIFKDKTNRKGFFKIKDSALDTGGYINIEVKIVQ
jgi:hypothetical protein